MLKRYAVAYLEIGHDLASSRDRLALLASGGTKTIARGDPAHSAAMGALGFARGVCTHLPLGTLYKEIERAELNSRGQTSVDGLKNEVSRLYERFKDELEERYFLYVPADRAALYGKKKPFGPLVFERFSAANDDIEEAHKCAAVGHATACVFHLMRAMEVAVRRLARRLKITIHPKDTWGLIVGRMAPKIAAMKDDTPARKRKKDAWAAASVNLQHVGQAWRNTTMHPAKHYSPEQAMEVLNAVRTFMSGLAAL